MARALNHPELELLLHCERGGWVHSDTRSEQHALSSLIVQGLLIQQGEYCHITVAGVEARNQLRNGSTPDVLNR